MFVVDVLMLVDDVDDVDELLCLVLIILHVDTHELDELIE